MQSVLIVSYIIFLFISAFFLKNDVYHGGWHAQRMSWILFLILDTNVVYRSNWGMHINPVDILLKRQGLFHLVKTQN